MRLRRTHVADYFQLRQPERNTSERLVEERRARLRRRDPAIAGVKVEIDSGEAAGQIVSCP